MLPHSMLPYNRKWDFHNKTVKCKEKLTEI